MNNGLTRPGISAEYLAANGIRRIAKDEAVSLVGCPEEGILLPYYMPDGRVPVYDPTDKPFGRLRKEVVASGDKYHQPAGTRVHSYLPTNWQPNCSEPVLNLVEGEFKGLSLTDSSQGYVAPTVSITGIYASCLKLEEGDETPQPTPELAMALSIAKPSRINFIGDNDTTCNYDFSIAVCRLREMLPNVDIFLPRISLADPKGVDDCRQHYGSKFELWFRTLLDDAIAVTSDLTPDLLALKMIERDLPAIGGLSSTMKTLPVEKFAKLASRAGHGARQQLIQMLGKLLGVGKTAFRQIIAGSGPVRCLRRHAKRVCAVSDRRFRASIITGATISARTVTLTPPWLAGRIFFWRWGMNQTSQSLTPKMVFTSSRRRM